MPKQFGILTDKGRINFGIIKLDSPSRAIGSVVQMPTNLLGFSGLSSEPANDWKFVPDSIPQGPPNFTCHLPNGNRITMATWRNTRLSEDNCTLTIEFASKTQTPKIWHCNFEVYYDGNKQDIYSTGLFTYFPYYTELEKKYTAGSVSRQNYGPDETSFYIGQQLRVRDGIYGDWFVEFTDGAIAPNFPGPDNEKDPAGGDGDGPEDIEDDPIEAPEDPSISAVASGLLTLYTPTLGQIHAFGEFLWSDLFSLDTFKKLFSDPMQAVIGLSALPISVPASGVQNIIIGSVDSGVSANRAAKQFVRKDCGTIHIKPTWNTALDYEPYTKFSIFLPYIGTRELKTDDIMNKDINVSYLIDILSGSCTAHIKVGGSVLYQFSGSCAVPIPVTGTSWNNLLTSCIQLAGAGIVTAASGGAASAAVAGAMAASSTANMVANAKPNIQRTGAVSGAAGMLGVQTPYLIRETPRQSLAKGYNKFVGYPSNITSKLGDLKGFTQVENIHLENLSCTADEAAEIESLLKEGVII